MPFATFGRFKDTVSLLGEPDLGGEVGALGRISGNPLFESCGIDGTLFVFCLFQPDFLFLLVLFFGVDWHIEVHILISDPELMFQFVSDLLLQVPQPLIREYAMCLHQLIKLDVLALLAPKTFDLACAFVNSKLIYAFKQVLKEGERMPFNDHVYEVITASIDINKLLIRQEVEAREGITLVKQELGKAFAGNLCV